jgi:uncharacterized protein (TIGR03083 family)
MSTRLPPERYLQHLESDSARFREVLEATPAGTPVPSCPDWDADDLLWHLATVQRQWAVVVTQRPAGPDELQDTEPDRPSSRTELLLAFDRWSGELLDALGAAPVTDAAWNWSQDHTVGFILRRQAHEALIHRLDAEQCAGSVTVLDPELASDGVVEALEVMYGGCPAWGTQAPTKAHVRVDCTDTDVQVWVNLARFTGTSPDGTVHDEDDIIVVADPGVEPDALVQGTAGALDQWLWHRSDGSDLDTEGSPAVLATFRSVLSQPID